MTLYDSEKKDFFKTLDIWDELHTPFYVLNYWKFKRHGKNPIADEPTAAENATTDCVSVKVEVVKQPTVQKIPIQLFLI